LFLSSFSGSFLCESEATATNVFSSESEASATSILCSESKATATNVFYAKAKRQLQLRQGEIDILGIITCHFSLYLMESLKVRNLNEKNTICFII